MLAAAVVLAVGAGLAWIGHQVHIGSLDALALADKVAVPDPGRAE
jgi:hypothetical protein